MKIVGSEVLYQGRLRAVRDTIECSDGRRYQHETIEHPGAVVILPVTDSGSIVFVEQYRHSLRQSILELPAGTLEKGEDPAICAERELMEEIGQAPGELISLGVLYPAPGFCTEVQYLFCARKLREQKATPDEDEAITVVEVAPDAINEMVLQGKLNDAKSIALVLKSRLAGLI